MARKTSAKLATYQRKRRFDRTPEPAGASRTRRSNRLSFVVQRHDASHLHYDFRLEWHGVLKSWAVPKGPSMDPADKRLAVEVEDHPVEYGGFEGTIPQGEYGGGTVQIWDRGTWTPEDESVDNGFAKGHLRFSLEGERLHGGFSLVRLKPRAREKRHNWLLIKRDDSQVEAGFRAGTFAESAKTGRTLEEIAAHGPTRPTRKAKFTSMPGFVPPQLATLATDVPDGGDWVHEIKLDGYRLQCRVQKGHAKVLTRSGLDWTRKFPVIAKAAATLPDGLYDGEAVVLDREGRSDFAALQQALEEGGKAPLLFLFDLLHDGTTDLRDRPLKERKAALLKRIKKNDKVLRYVEHFTTGGDAILKSACRLSLEGVVSKQADSPYRSGRNPLWLKTKCRGRDEFVIGGFTAGKKNHGLGALLLGARRGDNLVYLGRVGTGFDGRKAAALLKLLRPLARKTTPFHGRQPERTGDVTWATPELVAEVEYTGWTGDGLLRQASYKALREDKAAKDVSEPAAKTQTTFSGIAISHPEKKLWPADDITKGDFAAYIDRIAPLLLPQVANRPLSLLRAPDGIDKPTFFQRHRSPGMSTLVQPVKIAGTEKPYLAVKDAAGLVALAQFGVIELHPWGATLRNIERPDLITIDLDPGEKVKFEAVVMAAQLVRQRLEALDLPAFLKSTGGKGLHVVVPLKPRAEWPEVKTFARAFAHSLAAEAPEAFTATMSKKLRQGKIFIDYLRNERSATAIAAYSVRARPGAPVAVPLPWDDLEDFRPGQWTLRDAARLLQRRDPWADFDQARKTLNAAIQKKLIKNR